MLNKLVNHAVVQIVLEPAEPLLIASGVPNASGVDMPFVLTYRGDSDRGEVYLPGSSLKGVLRSHAERISRTIAPNAGVCDPHFTDATSKWPDGSGQRRTFCGKRLEEEKKKDKDKVTSADLYRHSCPICRTFGSTVYRGRLAVGDAHLAPGSTARPERRDGVGIDRFTGGASSGAKFELEVITQGRFLCKIRLENFEDWQVGLLALLCRDLEDEMISIGHGTTRGLGRLKGTIEELTIGYVRSAQVPGDPAKVVLGVGTLLAKGADGKSYGYEEDDGFELTEGVETRSDGIRVFQSFGKPDVRKSFFLTSINRWCQRMESWRHD